MQSINRRRFLKSSAGALSTSVLGEKLAAKPKNNVKSVSKQNVLLKEVDEVKVTLIMDNVTDVLMTSNEVAQRKPQGSSPFDFPLLIAEHGFCALITIRRGEKQGSVLLDTGASPMGILHNMDVLGISGSVIQAIIMSHGHTDHTMGLPALVQRLGSRRVPLILHPDACLDRKIFFKTGEVNLPAPKPSVLQHKNVELIKETRPSLLVDDMILVSGEIERVTDFEKGFPPNHTDRNGKWVSDPLIMDDQCVIVNVRGKGLVVITGCGHAGVINSIIYSQDLTGVQKVYMVTGGFHLCGGLFEKIIPPTIAELKKIGPRWVMPGHCTGWFATHQIARAMPDEFIPNCVGTTLII